MIQAKSLFKTYGNLNVVNGLSLHIKKGEVVAIVGPSGAGKTTLLHLLSTLDQWDENPSTRLEVDGQDLSKLNSKQLANFRNINMGFVFQFHQLLPEFTALENVCIPGYIKGDPKEKVKARATELLGLLGLENRLNHKPSQLSGGEQQRVAVARALVNQPKLLFADEPSGNLDSESAEKLHQLFFELRERFGLTIVLVTHNPKLAAEADRTLKLVDGNWHDA